MKKGIKIIICLLIGVLMLCGCSKKDDSTASSNTAYDKGSTPSTSTYNGGTATGIGSSSSDTKNSAEAKTDNTSASKTTNATSKTNTNIEDRKVVKKATITMEAKKIKETINFITETVNKDGGYIESFVTGTNESVQTAQFTVRIPEDKLEIFLKSSENFGTLKNENVSGEDVTSQYFDTEARVKTLKVEEDRLLSILQKSGSLQDILDLEKRLEEVREEIESLTGTLKKLDNLTELATINITINEVKEKQKAIEKPVTFGDKIFNVLKESGNLLFNILETLAVVVAAIIPFAAIGAIIFIPARLIAKRFKKIKKE